MPQSAIDAAGIPFTTGQLLDLLDGGVTLQDHDGRIIYANVQAARLCGFASAAELLGASAADIGLRFESFDEAGVPVPADARPSTRALAGDTPPARDLLCRMADGRERWMRVRSVPLRDGAGETRGVLNLFTDVTAERAAIFRLSFLAEASAVLARSLDYRETLTRVARLVVPRIADWCVVYLETQRGLEPLTVAHVDPDEVGIAQALMWRYPPGPNRPSGAWQVYKTGQPLVTNDLTAEALEASGLASDYVAALKQMGLDAVLYVPLAARGRTFGVLSLVLSAPRTRFAPEDVSLVQALAERCGQAIDSAMLYGDARRELVERRVAEAALSAEKDRLMVTLRSIGDGVIATDTASRVTLLNPVAEALTGWSQAEAIGRPVDEVFRIVNQRTRQPAENPIAKVLATGHTVGLANHSALIARDGREVVIADSAAPIRDGTGAVKGVVLVFRDVTERERIDAELERASKLDSIGVLAGGIAHDFNNILTAILANVSLACAELGPDHRTTRRLQDAEKASKRARELTEQLLTFAKGGAPIRKRSSIAAIVREAVTLASAGSSSRVVVQEAPGAWSAEVDAGQIGQVVQNLVLNAIQAMPHGGRVNVDVRNVDVGDPPSVPLSPGPYVAIAVRDEGVGIAHEHLGKVFDPFFTTKQRGRGLGLASAYAILRKHDGHISVDSAPGLGSTFTVYLPAVPQAVEVVEPPSSGPTQGKGRLLVMDDELTVREVLQDVLDACGFEADGVADGAAAVAAYRAAMEAGRPYDGVILDLTVPGGMGGIPTLERLVRIDRNVRAIVSSGYSDDPVLARYRRHGFRGMIAKPFSLEELTRVVTEVLEEK